MDGELIKVLLVEDNPGDARLILEQLGKTAPKTIELVIVERLEEGLRHLDEEPQNILLLDLGLPDSRGLDTFLKTQEHAPHIPIVVLTDLDDHALALEAVRHGAQDYLVKGEVDGNILVRALHYAIERKQAEEEIRRRAAHLEAINAIIASATSVQDTSELIDTALDHTLKGFGLRHGGIWLVSGGRASRGIPIETNIAYPWGMVESPRKEHLPVTIEDWEVGGESRFP